MQRNKLGALRDWHTIEGDWEYTFQAFEGMSRRVEMHVISQGVSVFINEKLVAHGEGYQIVDVGVDAPQITVRFAQKPKGCTSVRLEGVGPREAGFYGGPSFTDTEPKPIGSVSPEVQAMFDTMQRNMLALRAQLDARK